jgi:uncharacterized protein (TIGR02147 family)
MDFRRVLQTELLKRCDTNSRYSLRAFAQSLGISHATLSHIIAGRRKLSPNMIERLGLKLGLELQEIQSVKTNPAAPTPYGELTIDTFVAISEWHHDAILELIHTKHFRSEPKWIAQKLGINVHQVNTAVERLKKLELLIERNGKWIDASKNNTTTLAPDFTHSALRKYLQKMFELSIESLNRDDIKNRDHNSNMIAIQKSDLPQAKKMLKDFRRQFAKFLQRPNTKPDSVYDLTTSFFPISKENS